MTFDRDFIRKVKILRGEEKQRKKIMIEHLDGSEISLLAQYNGKCLS